MSGRAIFWICVTAYYVVLAVHGIRAFLAKRTSRGVISSDGKNV